MHVQRAEDVLLQILFQGLARDNLDQAAEHVVTHAVRPALAGLMRQHALAEPLDLLGDRLQALFLVLLARRPGHSSAAPAGRPVPRPRTPRSAQAGGGP